MRTCSLFLSHVTVNWSWFVGLDCWSVKTSDHRPDFFLVTFWLFVNYNVTDKLLLIVTTVELISVLLALMNSFFLPLSFAALGSPSGFRRVWEARHDQWWLRVTAGWNLWSLGEEWGRQGGGGVLGPACQTLFSSWSWGVKLCVDVCVSWPLIRGWDAAAPDPHGRIAGLVCSDPATLMPLIPPTPTRRLMSHSELCRHAVIVCVRRLSGGGGIKRRCKEPPDPSSLRWCEQMIRLCMFACGE